MSFQFSNLFKDKEGKESSKRITGMFLLWVLTPTILVYGVTNGVVLSELSNILWPVMTTGAGLLGSSVAERRN